MKTLLAILLLASSNAMAHVPVLLLPLEGTPIASYFIGQSNISHAIYSELTRSDDYFIAQFNVPSDDPTVVVQLLTGVCKAIPQYEDYQPGALIFRGDVPWKKQGETNTQYVQRLKAAAVVKAESHYSKGNRPQFYEPFGKQTYWVGAEWTGQLDPGLYAIVVYSPDSNKGTFSLGLNTKEAWTPDLYKYAYQVLPKINAGLCNPTGYTGRLKL